MKGEFLSLEEAKTRHKNKRAINKLEVLLKHKDILDKQEIIESIEKVLKILGS